ncbi:hypothetical protein A3709_08450 [Halioglobus sp. HI00S01]|uniref:FAD:protein FMN transferase n=1 Tax=Halioglobus sp. HI00S01 TaxID=1822214 RepID=UPI0007C231ED|nr:FAD:protein FMN transferase [Halioglobus sp. HI00S01]KZX55019.1 hypothetical protein A3709_08450 [Halioglobus sp. HI00S01]
MTSKSRLHVFGRSCSLIITGPRNNGDELIAEAEQELRRLEAKFCSYEQHSLVSQINQVAGTGAFTELDAEARGLFDYATRLWEQSNHLFDPTTRLLQNCYSDNGGLTATESQLQSLLSIIGWSKLEITEAGARLESQGMLIDLNSLVCAYAVDCVRKLLLREDVASAMIELDQDVITIGKAADGANWLVGVRHPQGVRTAIARLKVNNAGFTKRGDFEKRISFNGENFGRGLSPIDGHPIPGLLSVVVVAENSLTASGAASIARLKTEQAAMAWLDTLGVQWMAIDRELTCHGPLAPR